MKLWNAITPLLIAIIPASATAVTMIESSDQDGALSRIYIDKSRARFEMPGNEGHIIMDTSKKTMHLVVHPQRMVVDMSPSLKSGHAKSAKQPSVQLKKKGSGPKILGYSTTLYEEYVNGQFCGSALSSTQAAKDSGISEFATSFSIMISEMNNMFSGMDSQYMDECDAVDINLGKTMNEIGFPLKSFDKHRQVDSIVTKLDKNARLPANAFSIPANYKVTTAQQFVEEALQPVAEELENMMQNIPPEALEMMQQQLENLPPEIREMMEKEMQQ